MEELMLLASSDGSVDFDDLPPTPSLTPLAPAFPHDGAFGVWG